MGFKTNLLLGMLILLAAFSSMPHQQGPEPCFAGTRAGDAQAHAATVGSILINEVMYAPGTPEVEGEWVELHNPGTSPVNVTGWTLSDQQGPVDFTFPVMEFPADGYALVWIKSGQNSTEFINGTAEFYMWKNTAILSNTGDDVLLSDAEGNTIDFMSYGQWDGPSVQPPPDDFEYEHSNATAPERFTLARFGDEFRASVPTPLYPNGDDSAPPILLTRVHYYAWGDNEFFTIHNPLDSAVDISSWYMTDQRGHVAFPTGTFIGPGDDITVAENGTNYQRHTLKDADFEYFDTDPAISSMVPIGSVPKLANNGDEAILCNNYRTPIDAFVYGDSNYFGPGWESEPVPRQPRGRVARRNFDNGYIDTNTSADWENIRQYVVGQSEFGTREYSVEGPMTLFASPDSSFSALAGMMDNATESMWLTVYEFTGYHLAHRLIQAAGRGVDVRVFLEGAPVGGISANGLYMARRIVEAGGQVRMMTNNAGEGMYARYNFVHAKYAVADGNTLAVMSENWGQSGIPRPGTVGNRGWGAIIRDPGVAGYFAEVFLEDWNPERSDSVAFDHYHKLWSTGFNSTVATYAFGPKFPSLEVTSDSKAVPVLSPDTSLSPGTVLGMLNSATERLLVSQFYIYTHWGSRADGSVETAPNLYLESVIDAARRGCQVRVLLDSTYYNVQEDDPVSNDNTVDYVNAVAAAEGLDMEAKLVNLDEHAFDKIHNKGLVADDSVLISSINWNLNSVTRNREAGMIIRNREAADYFAGIFDFDWIDDLTPPFAHFFLEDSYPANVTLNLDATTSSDNVGIVNYTWTLDGLPVCYDMYFVRAFEIPGQYTLNLTVRDASGNAAFHVGVLNITEQGTADDTADVGDGGDDMVPVVIGVFLLVPIFIFLAILLAAKLRRR